MHAAREGGLIVGGAGAFPFELTVPGGTVATAGVTVVGTYPTHRRRGVLRAMMRAQLDDVHERGEPVALLWASEETIYGRFGYGMASLCGEISLPHRVRGVCPAVRARGHRPDRRAGGGAPALPQGVGSRAARDPRDARALPRLVGATASSSRRPAPREPVRSASSSSSATGAPRGTRSTATGPGSSRASRTRTSRWSRRLRSTAGRPRSSGATSSTSTGRRGSTRGCCRSTIRSCSSSPRRGACTSGSATGSGHGSWTWGRRSLRARYATDGAVVFDVVDAFCPWNEGRWRLADGRARRSSLGRAAPLRRERARRRLPRRVHVRRARAGRPGRGAASRRGRSGGRDLRAHPRPLVPRDLLGQPLEMRERGPSRGPSRSCESAVASRRRSRCSTSRARWRGRS